MHTSRHRIAVVAFSIVWTVFAAEWYLRIFDPVPILPRYIQAGANGVRENVPNAEYVHWTPEYTVTLRTNSEGIRDDREFAAQPPADTARIVLLGDSFAIGYGVNYVDSVPARLEEKLSRALRRPVEVVNLGVSGFGTAEELVMLESRGFHYSPDLVLVYWHDSDPVDNVRSSLFALDGDRLVRANASYLPAVELREWLFSFAAYRWLAGHSQLYSWLREFAARSAKALVEVLRAGDAESAHPADGDGVDPAEHLSLALLDEMRRRATAHGAGFLVAEVPGRVDRTHFQPTFPYASAEALGLSFDVVDPIADFEQHRGEKIYWERSHGHWTPLGTEAVASAIARRILEAGLLAPAPAPAPRSADAGPGVREP